MRPILRGTAAALAVPALSLAGLVATSTPASAAVDSGPADAAASWLVAQAPGGIVHNEQYDFDDIGLSADVALGLAGLGGHDAQVATIADAIAPRAQGEWYTSTYEGVTTTYAGSLAKAVVLAQAAGDDPTTFGGQNLVTALEATVSDAPGTLGRVQDVNNDFSDTNTFGQAYAAQGLAAVGSADAASVTAFLLEQQCSDGWFRLDFAKRDAAVQTCDGDAASTPDTDATAIALMALVSMHNDALVPAIDKAEAWLLQTQKKSGAWGGGKTTEAPNANSTGLAGWALAAVGGDDAAVADAAAWVRGHQLTNVANCVWFADADRGAIGYDSNAVQAAGATPIDAEKQDQFRRATAQALPLLQWAPAGDGDPQVLFAPGYSQAGKKVSVGVVGAAPGEALCAMLGEQSELGFANADGEAHLPLVTLKKPVTATIKVANADGRIGTADLVTLGATKLRISLKKKTVPTGGKQVVRVTGLAPGESVQLAYSLDWSGGGVGGGTAGQANGRGVFRTALTAPNRAGVERLKATGEFGNRTGKASFTVTR
jgi:hypothetical protein